MKNKKIVSKIAYLIGIKTDTLIKHFYENSYEKLLENQDANLISLLCEMRTNLMSHYFDEGFEFAAQSVFISYIIRLNKLGIRLNTELQTNFEYLLQINNLINDNINKCAIFFKEDNIDWLRIRNYIVFPLFNNQEVTESTIEYFCSHRELYPYGIFVNFRQKKQGNMLSFDELFLNVIGAKQTQNEQKNFYTHNYIDSFLSNNSDTDMLVDCENTDPFKFFEYLNGLKNESKNKLKCIYLISDSRAYFPGYFKNLNFKFSEISRIKSSKSLVDENLLFIISRLYYEQNQNSFVICSSDSDFMGMIDLFPSTNLFFVCDKNKTANRTISYLKKQKTAYEFFRNYEHKELEKFKLSVLKEEFREFLETNFRVNLGEILCNILFDTRIQLSSDEMDLVMNQIVSSTKFALDEDDILTFSVD